MNRQNCWEFKKCGREPGGLKVNTEGICPAALPNIYNGINKGQYAGRICWLVVGTYNNDKVLCTCAQKLKSCLHCDFLKYVNEQEGRDFVVIPRKTAN